MLSHVSTPAVHDVISHRRQCIFIRVPKTGSQSIASLIDAPFRTHTPARRFHAEYPNEFDRYFKFAFVRNPWDRLVSAFYYIRAGGCCRDDLKKKADWVGPVDGSFERFVEEILPLGFEGLYNPNVLLPQLHWLEDDGRIAVDFVGRYESLEGDWLRIAERLNVSPHLTTRNQSDHRDHAGYYNDRTWKIVADVYRRDIEAFGYRFEP